MTKFSPSGATLHHVKKVALGTTAMSIALMVGTAAMAAAPAANTLPGSFTTNTTGTSYTGTGSTALITVGTTTDNGQVIQFGGTALTNKISPTDTASSTGAALASATNSGFSVGAGASLTISGAPLMWRP